MTHSTIFQSSDLSNSSSVLLNYVINMTMWDANWEDHFLGSSGLFVGGNS